MLKDNLFKIRDLRKLPFREWNKATTYSSLLVISSGKRHSSGYSIMYIVGLNENFKPIEIAAACDDICWKMNGGSFRNDMHYPSGIMHYWSREYTFEVGISISTTDISLQKKSVNHNE
jgi:hypothetical protein